ncbi:Mitogen-activated protein kinase kinase kinase 3 [Diplonema papillatum]|nr:Mitogen-activated protein kinase kinase kinase 3 [Diplonema papillatum]
MVRVPKDSPMAAEMDSDDETQQRNASRGALGKMFKEIRVTNELLGKGAFGTVWLALGDTGEQLAVKRVTTSGTDWKVDVGKARQEYELLRRLDHKNIVKVHDFAVSSDSGTQHADIVMEYVSGGSISDLLQLFGPLPPSAVANFAREILEGLAYLHSNDIIHMDLKPSNILVTTTGGAKITDFGLSRRHTVLGGACVPGNSAVGTYPYMSPGQMAENRTTKLSDLWSVGCTVLEMSTNRPPWAERRLQQQQYVFVIGNAYETGDFPEISGDLPESLRGFIKMCLLAEKTQLTCEQALAHGFLPKELPEAANRSGSPGARIINCPSKIVGNVMTRLSEITGGGGDAPPAPPAAQTAPQQRAPLNHSDPEQAAPHTAKPQSTDQPLHAAAEPLSTSAAPAPLVSRVEQPCGDLFRMEEDLPWETLWHRIGQLDAFSATPFVLNCNYLFPLIRYLMCYATGQNKETVHYVDDYKPFERYFGSAEKMVEEVIELNKQQMFELNASTGSTENRMQHASRGSMLIRPSKSNRGTLALSVKREANGVIVTQHFFIMPAGTGGLSLAGFPGSPVGSTLLLLVNNLKQKFPLDFVRGTGQCEIPKISSSVYSFPT